MKFVKLILCGTLLFFIQHIIAQKKSHDIVKYSKEKGTWKFYLFPGNIIKATFQPKNYFHNEQISNAVVEKPVSIKGKEPFWINSNGKIEFNTQSHLSLLNYFDSGTFKGFHFSLAKDEKIYGTGERSLPLNRRGYKLNLYNNPSYGYGVNADNLNYSVPFIISSKGYGIFFDNPSKSYLDIGKADPGVLEYGASSGELSFYVIPGKNNYEILRKYQALVGTQPIPARWVFGNLMSRFGYRNKEQLMRIVDKMKKDNFPLDAVILDLFWFGDSIKQTMGNLQWNKKAWPDPEVMIHTLQLEGIKTILITEPYVLNTTPNYEPSIKFQAVDSTGNPFLLADFYFGHGGLLDLFRKDAQKWFWNKYKIQIKNGVTGWWGDLGEPERHPAAMFHNLRDLGFKRLFKADEVHNIFGHYWDKMLFDKYAKEYPDVRLFNLNRSGYAGSPRYGVFPWSGDVSRSWDGLKAQLPLMIGMSLSGVPYIHADAGGFAGGDGDMELYTRWIQFAVFTPVFRPHGTALGDLVTDRKDIASEAALYPDPYKSIARNSIQLRYKLLPYNYTLAYEEAKFGKLLVEPLFYYNTDDENLYKADDEYMWGDEILVAPVLQKAATERKIYLPERSWYDLITDIKVEGHQWITQKVTLENIPVFVKEGSFIPMFVSDKNIRTTNDYNGDISVKYYPSTKKTEYTMFDDDGKTNNTLSKGTYELIHFEGSQTGKNISIKIFEKKYGKARKIKFVLPEGNSIQEVKINNKPAKNNLPDIEFSGKPVSIEILIK